MSEYPYKKKIEMSVLSYGGRFTSPPDGHREYLLQNRCRADFCFKIKQGGMLFVEDDDGARGVNNLIKYWIWCVANPSVKAVHLVHILETSRPAQVISIKFLAEKMQDVVRGFKYHLITISSWQVPVDSWLPELNEKLKGISELVSSD